jgi:TonB family protein
MKLMGLRGRNASWGLAAAAMALAAFVGSTAPTARAQDAPATPELGVSQSAGELLGLRTAPARIIRPAPQDVSLHYPPLARRLKKTGRAVLACDVNSQGDVNECAVVEEFPIGWGFGQAARRIASDLRAAPAQEQGLPVGEGRVIVPVTFIVRPVRAS